MGRRVDQAKRVVVQRAVHSGAVPLRKVSCAEPGLTSAEAVDDELACQCWPAVRLWSLDHAVRPSDFTSPCSLFLLLPLLRRDSISRVLHFLTAVKCHLVLNVGTFSREILACNCVALTELVPIQLVELLHTVRNLDHKWARPSRRPSMP